MGLRPYEKSPDTGNRFPGAMLLKPKSRLKQYNMSYKEGRTLIRPWGDMLPTGEMAPWRDNEGHFGTSWFVQDDVCQQWGKDFKFTCMTRCEDEQNWPTGSPLQLLYDEVKFAPQYKHLTDRNAGTWSVISAPRHFGFLKGLLIAFNGKDKSNRPTWGVLLTLPPSAREALDALLNQQAAGDMKPEASDSDPFGWNSKYYVGDPIGLACGKVFEFDMESKLTGKSADAGEINLDGSGAGGKDKDGKVIEKYGCRIFPGRKVLSLANKVNEISKCDEKFEDALWYMTGEEQITNLIIRGFGHSHRDLLLYIFGNKTLPDGRPMLPAAFEKGRTTVDMNRRPAATTMAQQSDPAVNINLDGGDAPDDEPVAEPSNAPWDDNQSAAQGRTAEGPVFTPQPDAAAAAPAGGTADSIRARLAAAKAKQG